MISSWDQQLQHLVSTKQWRNILALGTSSPIEDKSRYLWAWPTENNLKFIESLMKSFDISRILSIGCGSGLLEWIINESTGIRVYGVELDHSWWTSSYSPKTFVNLTFVQSDVSSNFLLNACDSTDWDFALLFCYFNNHDAFVRYLDAYRGNYLIVIGPEIDSGRHTDPGPFELNLDEDDEWTLKDSCRIGNSIDFIAVYVRKGNKSKKN